VRGVSELMLSLRTFAIFVVDIMIDNYLGALSKHLCWIDYDRMEVMLTGLLPTPTRLCRCRGWVRPRTWQRRSASLSAMTLLSPREQRSPSMAVLHARDVKSPQGSHFRGIPWYPLRLSRHVSLSISRAKHVAIHDGCILCSPEGPVDCPGLQVGTLMLLMKQGVLGFLDTPTGRNRAGGSSTVKPSARVGHEGRYESINFGDVCPSL